MKATILDIQSHSILCKAFPCLQFFGLENIGKKTARKMLIKWTPGRLLHFVDKEFKSMTSMLFELMPSATTSLLCPVAEKLFLGPRHTRYFGTQLCDKNIVLSH